MVLLNKNKSSFHVLKLVGKTLVLSFTVPKFWTIFIAHDTIWLQYNNYGLE